MSKHTVQDFVVKGKEVFVGLEDSKKTWKVAVRSEKILIHQASMEAKYPVLKGYLDNKFPECTIHVMYEAGFRGFNLHDQLTDDAIDCIVIPPHLVTEEKVNKVKTDKRDAKRLAVVLENHDYKSGCDIPDKERRGDRQISRTLIAITKDVVRTRNRIRKFLDFHGIEVPFAGKAAWGKHEFLALKELPSEDKPCHIPRDIGTVVVPSGKSESIPSRSLPEGTLPKDIRDRTESSRNRLVYRDPAGPGAGGGSEPFRKWEKDSRFCRTDPRRALDGGYNQEREDYGHGIGVHPICSHREFLGGNPEGPGPSR